jgi:hypothetical protein
MATATRAELRLLVEQLADEDLDTAREALHRLAKRAGAREVPEYHRRLLAEGVIDRLPDPSAASKVEPFTPIRVEGKPISATLIEDRRR